MQPPDDTEFNPYFSRYIRLVPSGPFLDMFRSQIDAFTSLIQPLTTAQADHRYADGKWMLKEVVGHVLDTERVFGYRALHLARGDRNPLPSFDQDAWIPTAQFNLRTMPSILSEWVAVRRAHIAFAEGAPPELLTQCGTIGGNQGSARAMLYIMAGHVLYHTAHIREKYLSGH